MMLTKQMEENCTTKICWVYGFLTGITFTDPDTLVQFPCLKCNRAVAKNHKAVQCDICDKWVQIALTISTQIHAKNSKKINLLGIVFAAFKRNYHIAQFTVMY